MSEEIFDLLVIGAGSGGVRAARVAAQAGAKVAVVEERFLGGTCVNVGCVPKKLFVYSASYRDLLSDAKGFGWSIADQHFDWHTLRENKNKEIARLNNVYRNLLLSAGVTLLEGRAYIMDSQRVKIGEQEYRTKRLLIAVGGKPHIPSFPGSEWVITSDDAFYLDELPEKIVIVGGGYIGVEFAGIFNGLGVETHLCHRGEKLLKGFDEDIQHFIAQEMQKKGIHLHFNADISKIEKDGNNFNVSSRDGRHWSVGKVMYATGRKANTHGLGLENTAVVLCEKGNIDVDDKWQTADPAIYAIGDVVERKALTPVALAEGTMLANNLFNGTQQTLNYLNIPTAVFSQLPIATVGLTEAEALKLTHDIDVYTTRFTPMLFAFSDSDEKTFMKLIVGRQDDKVLGCHMVGPYAAEIMQGLAIAIQAGATKKIFDQTLGIHPTLAEEFVTLRETNKRKPV